MLRLYRPFPAIINPFVSLAESFFALTSRNSVFSLLKMSVHPEYVSSHVGKSNPDEYISVEPEREREQQSSSFELLVSGAFSGAIAKTFIAPMDRVKILFQTDPRRRFSVRNSFKLAREIYYNAGLSGFWKGHTATLVRVVPYSATNYLVFARVRDMMEANVGGLVHPVGIKFLAGAISGSCAVCVSYPLETLRARLAVDLEVKYSRGYWQAVSTIARSDGILSLYAGLKPTLFGIIPYAGTSFAVYETLKGDNTVGKRFLIGALAGFSAQAATYPLDVVRRRMQVSPHSNASFLSTMKRIYAEEGVRAGLYKGLSMNAVKGPIAVAISLNVNDYLREFFLSRQTS